MSTEELRIVIEGLVATARLQADNMSKAVERLAVHQERIAQLEAMVETLQRQIYKLDDRTIGSMRIGAS